MEFWTITNIDSKCLKKLKLFHAYYRKVELQEMIGYSYSNVMMTYIIL